MSNRSRNFCFVSYLPKDVLDRLCKSSRCSRYAYILHDSDVNSDGTLKEPHYHVVLSYRDARSLSAVRKEFEGYKIQYGANTLSEVCFDMRSALRYLIHADDPDKFQYKISSVVHNLSNLLDFEECVNAGCISLLDDILNEVPLRVMVSRYGRDFIIHYDKYVTFARMMFTEEHSLEPMLPCDVPCEISENLIIRKMGV